MREVKAGIEYKINLNNKSFLLGRKKYKLLDKINSFGSISEAAKLTEISYRTALNHIEKIESSLDIKIVETQKGGKGGGGKTSLSEEGFAILKECKKINAIMELHKDANELKSVVKKIDSEKGVMIIGIKDIDINIPLNNKYEIGDKILALINYDNIFLMLEPYDSSIRNNLKGKIVELSLNNKIIRVKIDIGGIFIYSDITISAAKELDLELGKEIYVGFKAMSVATLKL
ncbi:MAG: TOBE domain-containing protein [Methanobacteriaceae archaeon]|jgi:molybdate transport system regulatory protein|nr:TOBE domain-containing protein [Methanobacteriaceae archaeon]